MKNPDLSDFQIVIDEIFRLHTLINKREFKRLDKYDVFWDIKDPRNGRRVLIGQKGRQAFCDVAKRTLKQDVHLRKRVSEGVVLQAISEEFAREILGNGESLSPALAKDIVANALAVARGRLDKQVCHFIPCVLAYHSSKDQFNIGPVSFQTTASFIAERARQFDEETQRTIQLWAKGAAKHSGTFRNLWPVLHLKKEAAAFTESAIKILKSYKWIATVQLQDFEETVGRDVANSCVETALNIARLFIGGEHAEQFRIGGGLRLERDSVRLSENHAGEISITLSHTSEDAQLGKDWVNGRFGGEAEQWVQLAGSLIRKLQSGFDIPILYRRYIIALWWYGEGVSEPHDHAKVVRFATAIEAYLATPIEKDDAGKPVESIMDQLSRRACNLLEDNASDEGREICREIKKFYDIRSRLVHGEYAPFDKTAATFAFKGERLVRKILIEGLSWTSWLASQNYNMTVKEIGEHFDSVLPKVKISKS